VLRPELLVIAQALLASGAPTISLDQIAEALGTLRVTPDEIEELFSWLEGQGCDVGSAPTRGSSVLLGEVLAVARGLRQELGRAPHPREIAERSSLSLEAVQRALFFARILQR
jgi:DNA-directed RNA polymerase sigma subunit (sigma70/sigma32)